MKLAVFPLAVVLATCISSVGVAQNLQWGLAATYSIPSNGGAIAPASLCAGDLNGDGRTDLIIGNAGTTPSHWLALSQAGGGLVVSGQQLSGGVALRTVRLGRFTTDQLPDLAFNSSGGAVYVSTGLGNGSFGAPNSIFPSFSSDTLVTADFNQDGFDDVATIRAAQIAAVYVYYSNAGNGFYLPIALDFANGLNQPRLAAGDVDGDGDQDLARPIHEQQVRAVLDAPKPLDVGLQLTA